MIFVNIVVLGMQGAGKGTQAGLLRDHFQISHVCTGDIFREEFRKGSKLGVKAHSFWGKGNLVPDAVTNNLVRERLNCSDCVNGFVLDGYPRTVPQAEFLESISRIDFVIDLELSEDIAIKRLSSREQCSKCGKLHGLDVPPKVLGICNTCGGKLYRRDDDTPSKIKVRIAEYKKKTLPLLEYYSSQGKLFTVDAGKSIQEVFVEIHELLG